MVRIDTSAAKASSLAWLLSQLRSPRVDSPPYVGALYDRLSLERRAEFLLLSSQLLFGFRKFSLSAFESVGLEPNKRTELFYRWVQAPLKSAEDAWALSRLATAETDTVRRLFYPGVESPQVTNVRVGFVVDAARKLSAVAPGGVLEWLQKFDSASGPSGLVNWLATHLNGYRDPAEKKAIVASRYLAATKAFQPADLGELPVAVDYHLMRVALRFGLVSLPGRSTNGPLRVSQSEFAALRLAIRDSFGGVSERAKLGTGFVDKVVWQIGRESCLPICPKCVTCPLKVECNAASQAFPLVEPNNETVFF